MGRKKKKEVVRIQLDFLQGPNWISDIETGEPFTGIDIIDNDEIIRELNHKAGDMFSSYYEIDSHDLLVWFNLEKEKEIMLDLITRLIARLNEINDGSYVIEDLETERIKKL